MGNSNKDRYFTEKVGVAAASFKRSCVYFWIDPDTNSNQNRVYLQIIKNIAQIVPLENWEALPAILTSILTVSQPRICVISSSFFSDEAYSYLQSDLRINKVVLFTQSEERGLQLKSRYPRIGRSLPSIEDVISEIRLFEQEETESIYFFCQQEMGKLNRWMSNWLTLQQEANRQQGKGDFRDFMNALTPGSPDLKKFDKAYDISKNESQRQAMVLDWIKADNFYLQVPAAMLAKMRDTFTLAFIRLPFFDIYSTLKTTYALKGYGDIEAYAKISLNQHELGIMKNGRFDFIYFSTFLVCELDAGRRSIYSNQFLCKIRLRERSKDTDWMDCGGFFINQQSNQVFLNIDNPFQVLNIDLQQREITLQLAHIPRHQMDDGSPMAAVQLHRKFIRYLARTIPGQLLPSYYNDQLSLHQQFVEIELNFADSVTPHLNILISRVIRKVELAKLKIFFHLDKLDSIERQLLEAKELCKNVSVQAKIKIYLLLLQVNLRASDCLSIKFSRCMERMKDIHSKFPEKFTDEEVRKFNLYSIYSHVVNKRSQIEYNLQMVMQIEADCNSRMRQHSGVSELYLLIMQTKIKCNEFLLDFKKVYALFEEVTNNIRVCQGQNEVYIYFKELQMNLILKERQVTNERQKQEQRSRCSSAVALHLLPTHPYPINFSIDSTIFTKDNDSQYYD